MKDDSKLHINEILDPIIAKAPEEKLSSTIYMTHLDPEDPTKTVDEFIPVKSIHHLDGPSIEYINEKGETVVEVVDKIGGKYEILDKQSHIPGKREHPHHYLKDQPEFELE